LRSFVDCGELCDRATAPAGRCGCLDELRFDAYGPWAEQARLSKRDQSRNFRIKTGDPNVPHEPASGGGPATADPTVDGPERAAADDLLELVPTAVVLTDLGGFITYLNGPARSLLGLPTHVPGRHIRDVLPFVDEPPTSSSSAPVGRLTDASGRGIDVEVLCRVAESVDAEPAYVLYVIQDISRHAEMNRMREQLLYSVAHELRGPLMVLDNAVEILETEYSRLTADEFVQILSTARRTARRMRTLMEDLLSAGSIQSGQFVVMPSQTDVQVLLSDALDIVLPAMEGRGQRLSNDLPLDLPLVLADRRYARQVLTNLLANAAKYGPPKSIIRVSGEVVGQMVRLSVEDQGHGIPMDQQVGLFERFYRVRTQGDAPGVGLGLAIARGIVEAHGGVIGIDSAPGSGTRVWFTLPSAAR
jgi:signal transduction histidine kinase